MPSVDGDLRMAVNTSCGLGYPKFYWVISKTVSTCLVLWLTPLLHLFVSMYHTLDFVHISVLSQLNPYKTNIPSLKMSIL